MKRLEHLDTGCHECGVKEGELHDLGCQKEKCPFCGKMLVACICHMHLKLGNVECPFCNNEVSRCECGGNVILEEMQRKVAPFNGIEFDQEKIDGMSRVAREFKEKNEEIPLTAMISFMGAIKLDNGMSFDEFFSILKQKTNTTKDEYILAFKDDQFTDEEWIKTLEMKGRNPHIFIPNLCSRCGKINPPFFMIPDKEWEAVIPNHLQSSIFCKECYEFIRELVGYKNGVNVDDYTFNGKLENILRIEYRDDENFNRQ